MRGICFALALGLVLTPFSARAEIASASPSMFVIEAEAEIEATPAQAWRALGRIARWWNDQHTFSGDASNLSLEARAGGCWCERWGRGQSVQHGRVILAAELEGVRMLRAEAALGPLQDMAVNGVMTFTIEPHAQGAKITVTYRVAGDQGLDLDQLAAPVNMVLMEQFGRLSRFSATGSPN
jgi:uncharacterized protein YndB with AHSA1/START domain